MIVRLPILLDGQMKERARLRPSEMAISFNLYSPHIANASFPTSGDVPSLLDWVELFTVKGSAGIYRVSTIDDTIGNYARVGFKHGISILADDALKIGDEPIKGTAEGLLRRFWAAEGVVKAPQFWQLGEIAGTPELEYVPNNHNLLQAVQEVVKLSRNCALEYDQSVFPWVLNVVKLSDANPCEGRFARNLEGVQRSIHARDLVTRVYLDTRDGYTDADTIGVWGVFGKTLPVPENATDPSISAYVSEYLEAHKEPTVSIRLAGADLSRITGESIDSFQIGRLCRACIPDYNTTIVERVVVLEYNDVYGDPEGVRVTLANKQENASTLLRFIEQESQSSSNYQVVNSRRVNTVAADLRKTSETLTVVNGNLTQRINEVAIELDKAIKLKANQTDLDLVTGRTTKLEAELKVAADEITATVKRVGAAEASLKVTADEVSTKVSKDGVISAINQTAESVRISASRINLDGYVTTSQLSSEIANINNQWSSKVSTAELEVTRGFNYLGHSIGRRSRTVITGLPGFTTATITLANGNQVKVVTGWNDTPTTRTLYYLGDSDA